MKNQKILLFFSSVLLFALTFSGCEKEELIQSGPLSDQELADIHLCLTTDANETYDTETPPTGEVQARAVGMKNRFWSPGQTLRVRFLNGSSTLQNKVMSYAEQWEQYANINFVKVTSGTSEIRVAFSNDGHWSSLGKDALDVPQNQRTTNFDFTSSTPETEIRGTTLHEFGHVLGLKHEHQNPLVNIPWNKPAVYQYFAQQGWSKEKVDYNVLNRLDWSDTQHTVFDPKSIMLYSFPASLTTNGSSTAENTELSTIDKVYIAQKYSFNTFQIRNAANAQYAITFWLNGIYYTLAPGESVVASAKTSSNQLSIWRCPSNSNCSWNYYENVPYGRNYKIVSNGSYGDLKLVYD